MLHQRYNAKIRPLGARVKNESFNKLKGLVTRNNNQWTMYNT